MRFFGWSKQSLKRMGPMGSRALLPKGHSCSSFGKKVKAQKGIKIGWKYKSPKKEAARWIVQHSLKRFPSVANAKIVRWSLVLSLSRADVANISVEHIGWQRITTVPLIIRQKERKSFWNIWAQRLSVKKSRLFKSPQNWARSRFVLEQSPDTNAQSQHSPYYSTSCPPQQVF